jgi:hypothetical protein
MSDENVKDKDEEVQSFPVQLIPASGGVVNLEEAVKNAEKYLEFQDRIRKAAIKLTSLQDWIDEGGKPYCQWTGTSKIANAFGVTYKIENILPEKNSDEHGEYVDYTAVGMVKWNGREVPEVGTGSTRDPFFGKKNGVRIPLSEIDRTDIKKKALTNFLNRGIKDLIGLSFTWQEIETITEGRITQEKVKAAGGGVSFDKKPGHTDSAEAKDYREKIRTMLIDMCGGDTESAKLALVKYTSFKDKTSGKEVPGKDNVKYLSDKAAEVTYHKIKEEYEKIGKPENKVNVNENT